MVSNFPALFPFHGDWSRYVEDLYAIYQDELVHGGLEFRDFPVKTQYRPPSLGKGYGFWHVISDGPEEEGRIPDLRRCERIRWIAWMIRNVDTDARISWWRNKRGANTHIVLWMETEDFVVVLAERQGYYLLKTAYCLKAHRRKSFEKERAAFRQAENG